MAIETQRKIIDPDLVEISQIASRDQGFTVWTEGVKRHLLYDPDDLRDLVDSFDNQDMIGLTDILQERKTFSVTEDILWEMVIRSSPIEMLTHLPS